MVERFKVYTLTALENSEEIKKQLKVFFKMQHNSSSTSTLSSVES